MGELAPRSNGEIAHEVEEELDYERILTHLLRIAEREGIDTDEDDLRLMLGEDDNDLLGNIASWAWENGIMDHEDLFIELGIPAEIFIDSGDGPDVSDGLVEITDGTGYTEGNISRELE